MLKELNRTKTKIDGKYIYRVNCQCHCGNLVNVSYSNYSTGHAKSCGCVSKELGRKQFLKHGESKTKFWRIWQGMIGRCTQPKHTSYKDYGGRGIKISLRWSHYTLFKKDMYSTYKEGLELDRVNNNGNYSKSNCRWVTHKENCNNRREVAGNIEYKNEKKTLNSWCRQLGLNKNTMFRRLNRQKLTFEQAINYKRTYSRKEEKYTKN